MSETSDMVRKMFKEGDDVRDAGLTTPSDIARLDDIAYASDDPCQLLDVYRPRGAAGVRLPVIVSVHGGGWVYGDKERYQYYCMSLAQRGFAVVNFTYRLAPEHKFPASLIDTDAVFHWVLEHAAEHSFDTDNIFAVGDSAGAHMLAIYAAALGDADYAAALGITPPSDLVLAAVALNCGAYHIEAKELTGDPMLDMTANLMADFLPEGGTDAEFDLISPLNHVGESFPSAFVMTAEADFLKGDALPLVEKLVDLRVDVCFRHYVSPITELAHVFHCDMRLAEAAAANDDECAFFRTHLN